ncbi:sulfurtransferase TusA family protein [Chitiniphilus purpureus]|uniref:Sulfurtransferase TusA family protein n=1 Tax=Chitiniphilus purpureus TaxID=2981137 RepID=A0ABY6DNK5_9NEIS|nr:sulfurtransferase TusA family protein [Chitiniphilus sp. CD1]UXY15931.1 sulfurtransferase TusA family protein [Chitiniphilus sp. CD1]
MTPHLTIDLSGLNCPLPILRTKKALAGLQAGQIVAVTCTDPATPTDFAAFCRQTGHELLQSQATDGQFHFLIRKRAD